ETAALDVEINHRNTHLILRGPRTCSSLSGPSRSLPNAACADPGHLTRHFLPFSGNFWPTLGATKPLCCDR
ncbi:MAG: hypothetical protein ACR2PG_08525, partial [Hyphomicrobiaceae bacterium]